MNNKILIAAVIAVIIGGAAGFFGGMQYQKSQPVTRGNFQRNAQGQNNQPGTPSGQRGGIGGAVNGQVLNKDDKSLTVKLRDGSSKIVLFSDKTAVSQATASAVANITQGETVMVFGSTNSDGSVTAQNIQINPNLPVNQGR
jgi:hypothetical protein